MEKKPPEERRRKGFRRVTAGILVAAALVQMVSVAFIRKKK